MKKIAEQGSKSISVDDTKNWSHCFLPETREECLAMNVTDLDPLIAFYCYCGEELYYQSAGCAMFYEDGGYECSRCGQKYKEGNGVIAEIVLPSLDEWHATVERLFA